MWIDYERRFGVIAGMFFGRQAWLYGADGSGTVSDSGGVILPHSRARRLVAARFE